MKTWIALLITCTACGKGAGGDVASAPGGDTSTAEDAAAAGDDAAMATDAEPDTREPSVFDRLAALEVPGMTRVRSQIRNDYVTLQFSAANATGTEATLEATIGRCDGCAPVSRSELEGRRDQLLAQLGELHAKNPSLVFSIEDLALPAGRQAVTTYAQSFVDDGQTRAAIHTLELSFVGDGFNVRVLAYPRSAFPSSQAELAQAFSKAELVAAVRAVFEAAAPILWGS